MKREMSVFLCVIAALFFGSCADLSMDDEKAIKADLPVDFNWQTYGEINGDVLMSQISIDLKEKGKGADIANCVNMFSDVNFAKEVYSNYLQCPEDGWDKSKECTGKYANNSNYSKPIITITEIPTEVINPDDPDDPDGPPIPGDPEIVRDTTKCTIGACWSGGWSELETLLPSKLDVVEAMCQFIPKDSDAAGAKEYLNNFQFDSYLVEQHYHFYGRIDGRPYKYCGSDRGVEKNQSLHANKRTTTNKEYYYDYGRYTFCLDKNDQKIYVVK